MAVDADVLDRIRERLRVSTRVGDDHIQVAARGDDVVLLGAVASPEEATVAAQLAEQYATAVVNELQVDRDLRQGVEEPAEGATAAPGADLNEALAENQPWMPPDVPQLAPTRTEERGGVSPKDREPPDPDPG